MIQGLSCEDCAWKEMKSKKDWDPCDFCIRSGTVVSKRNIVKNITLLGKDFKVPRDFYISKDMLEFVKQIVTDLAVKNLQQTTKNMGTYLNAAQRLRKTLMNVSIKKTRKRP